MTNCSISRAGIDAATARVCSKRGFCQEVLVDAPRRCCLLAAPAAPLAEIEASDDSLMHSQLSPCGIPKPAASEACPGGPRTCPAQSEPVAQTWRNRTRPDFPLFVSSRPAWPGADLSGLRRHQPEAPAVLDALQTYLQPATNANVTARGHQLSARPTDAFEGAREKVGHLHRCGHPREIVFTRHASEAINLVAQLGR